VSTSRWLDLEGVVNMRDVGGIPTADGGAIAPRRLLRSDNLQELSEASVRHLLDEVGVTDIVDLRTEVEVHLEGAGPLRAQPLTHHHHSLIREAPREQADPGDTAAQALVVPWSKRSGRPAPPKRDDDFWASHYLGYLADRPESVSAALHAVAGSTGAAIVHCAAGKDRTGTVVGLALKVVGVPDELVIADFAASAERVAAIMDRLRSKPAYADNLKDKTVAQQSPTTETMRMLLATLDERYDGPLGWLSAHGWTAADTERMRRKLLST
jgi:protein tyrosine/serine phosphatase